MALKIQFKRGIEANRPTLAIGELYYATDTETLWIGASPNAIPIARKKKYLAFNILGSFTVINGVRGVRVQSSGTLSGASLNVPPGSNSVLNIFLVGYYDSGTGSGPKNFTISTQYGGDGEAYNTYSESSVVTSLDIKDIGDLFRVNIYKADGGNTLFANASAGDIINFSIQNPSNTSIVWQYVLLEYM